MTDGTMTNGAVSIGTVGSGTVAKGAGARILATLALAGAALGASAAAAHADSAAAPLGGLSSLGGLKLYPLAHGRLDVLSNELDTNVSGIPVSTAPINQFFETGLPLNQVPVVNSLFTPPPAPAGN